MMIISPSSSSFTDEQQETIRNSLCTLAVLAGSLVEPSEKSGLAIKLLKHGNKGVVIARKMIRKMEAVGLIENDDRHTLYNDDVMQTFPTASHAVQFGSNVEMSIGEKDRITLRFSSSKPASEVIMLLKEACLHTQTNIERLSDRER